jgi:feruloyl esterase
LFDTLSRLERWVETGVAPDSIIAFRHGLGRGLGAPRSMPLCTFPDAAIYSESGDIDDAKN